MLPDNSQPTAQSSNPYGFITDHPEKPKISMTPKSKKGRILTILGLLIVLLIAFLVVNNLFGKAGRDQLNKYVEINKRQTEIIRLATLPEQKSKSQDVKSAALTTKLSVSSSQTEVSGIIKKRGVKAKDLTKQLNTSKNPASDAALTEAEQNNRFDETYQKIIETELRNYQKQLSEAANGATKTERSVLESTFNQVGLLLPNSKT